MHICEISNSLRQIVQYAINHICHWNDLQVEFKGLSTDGNNVITYSYECSVFKNPHTHHRSVNLSHAHILANVVVCVCFHTRPSMKYLFGTYCTDVAQS